MCSGKTEREQRECNGGAGCCVYRKPDTTHYSDKGGHRERSEANDERSGGHSEHWKKEERKRGRTSLE